MFQDYLIDFGFSVVFSILRQVIKNPSSKETYKKVMLKIRNQINVAFADDPDF